MYEYKNIVHIQTKKPTNLVGFNRFQALSIHKDSLL